MADQTNPLGSTVTRAPVVPLAAAEPLQGSDRTTATKAPAPRPERPVESPLKPSRAEVEEAAKEVDGFLKKSSSTLELKQNSVDASYSDLLFRVDPDSGISFFKVVDVNTRKVIRQIPSEEVLAMARKLRELSGQTDAKGVLMNEEG